MGGELAICFGPAPPRCADTTNTGAISADYCSSLILIDIELKFGIIFFKDSILENKALEMRQERQSLAQ